MPPDELGKLARVVRRQRLSGWLLVVASYLVGCALFAAVFTAAYSPGTPWWKALLDVLAGAAATAAYWALVRLTSPHLFKSLARGPTRAEHVAMGAVRGTLVMPSWPSEPDFDRFTPQARRALALAEEEALLLNHSFIGTEHILLGLIHEGEGLGSRAINSLGISLEAVREEVEATIGPAGAAPTGSPPYTPRAKKALQLALSEALQLGHTHVDTEHLLLGLVREGHGVASQVLVSLGAQLSRVRQQVFLLLGGAGSAAPSPWAATNTEPARTRGAAVGDDWTVQVVRAGRDPAAYTRAYEALADLVSAQGCALDELSAGRISVNSVVTSEGPGLRLVMRSWAAARSNDEEPEASTESGARPEEPGGASGEQEPPPAG